MDEDFEQNQFSRKANRIYESGYESKQLSKSIANFDKNYENIIRFDSSASVLSTSVLTASVLGDTCEW